MASGTEFVCDHCARRVTAWDDGPPDDIAAGPTFSVVS